MRGFWRRRTELEQLEARLRTERPEPSDELVRRASAVLQNAGSSGRLSRLRFALVGILTVLLLAALSAFGGLTVVASGASHATTFITSGSFSKKNESGERGRAGSTNSRGTNSNNREEDEEEDDPDDDQYEDDITICHRQGGERETLRLSASAAARHLANHPRDRLGPCRRLNND